MKITARGSSRPHSSPRPRRPARRATTRRSPARAARSSRRSSRRGRPRSARRSATPCSTAPSAPAPASRRSPADQVDFGASDAPLTPDQATACKDCVQIPWALSATAVAYNVPGAPVAPEPRREDDLEDLPRPDHELERPGDQGAEQGREPARPEDHAGLPLGRLGHVVQLHRLPLGGEPRVEVEGRQLDRSQPSRPGSAREGLGRRRRARLAHAGAITYVDVAYALKNHIKFAAVRNAAGKFLFPSLRRHRGRGRRVHEGAGEQRAAHRQPAEVGAARLPDLHLHLRDRPPADVARGRAAQDDLLGADPGSGLAVRGEAHSSRRFDRRRCSSRPRRR